MPRAEFNPAFWRWFGQSKVVDSAGQPLRMYHTGLFDETEDPVAVVGAEGFHFGTKNAAEERDAGKRVDDFIREMTVEQDDDNGRWYWSSEGVDSYDVVGEEGFDTEAQARRNGEQFASDQEFSGSEPFPMTTAYLAIQNPKRVRDQKASWVVAVAAAKVQGHDGIVYRNEVEDKGKDSWIAFYPEQIKSATGNDGSWDADDPDITSNPGKTPPIPILEESASDLIQEPELLFSRITEIIGEDGEKIKGFDHTSGVSLGLRGIYASEIGKVKLKRSFESPDGVSGRRLSGTSTIALAGDWGIQGFTGDPREALKRVLSYGDQEYIAIVAGNLQKDEIFNDIGEAVLGDARVIAYIPRYGLEHSPDITSNPGETRLLNYWVDQHGEVLQVDSHHYDLWTHYTGPKAYENFIEDYELMREVQHAVYGKSSVRLTVAGSETGAELNLTNEDALSNLLLGLAKLRLTGNLTLEDALSLKSISTTVKEFKESGL